MSFPDIPRLNWVSVSQLMTRAMPRLPPGQSPFPVRSEFPEIFFHIAIFGQPESTTIAPRAWRRAELTQHYCKSRSTVVAVNQGQMTFLPRWLTVSGPERNRPRDNR